MTSATGTDAHRTTGIGINGFGRMGRLVVRALQHQPTLQLVHVNELKGDVTTAAHLLEFDTVHGRYRGQVGVEGATLKIDGTTVTYSAEATPDAVDWDEHGVDIVLECTGKFLTVTTLERYFACGVSV